MNAYEYGIDHFNFKYQPMPNVIIFNDNDVFVDDFGTSENGQQLPVSTIPTEYIYAEAYVLNDGTYKLYEPIRRIATPYVEDYLIPNNYLTDLGDNNEVDNAVGAYQVYKFENTFYVKYEYPGIQDGTVITGKPGSLKLFALSDVKLAKLMESNIKFFLFFSEEGEKLNKAYHAITETLPDEIIFFIEKDGFGNRNSVVRVSTGSDITSKRALPAKDVAYLAESLGVDASINDIEKQLKEVFKMHLEFVKKEKERGVAYWISEILETPQVINETILFGIGSILKDLGDGISTTFVFDDKRWKYYNENGAKAKDFSPIFPGFETLLKKVDDSEKANSDKGDTFEMVIAGLENKIDTFFNDTSEDSNFKNLLKKHFGFINTLISKLKELYATFKETFTHKNGLIFGNALFIGIVNSLVKAIGGILSLVGAILKYPYESREAAEELKRQFKKSTSLSSAMEVIEEFMQTLDKLFTKKNMETLFDGFVQMGQLALTTFSNPEQLLSLNRAFTLTVADKTVDAAKYLSVRIDHIGYGLGFAIGFIIEEVITAIATGGAKTVGTALKLTATSFEELLKLGGRGVKTLGKAPKSFVETIIKLFRSLRRLDVQKHMDDLIALMVSLFKTTKQLAVKAFENLFTKQQQNRMRIKAKLEPTSVDDLGVITFCPIKA